MSDPMTAAEAPRVVFQGNRLLGGPGWNVVYHDRRYPFKTFIQANSIAEGLADGSVDPDSYAHSSLDDFIRVHAPQGRRTHLVPRHTTNRTLCGLWQSCGTYGTPVAADTGALPLCTRCVEIGGAS